MRCNFETDLAHFTPRQMRALELLDSGKIKFLLYGGALGGGKSYFLRWYGLRRLIYLSMKGYVTPVGMLACEDYPALKDRQLSKIPREFPREMGVLHVDHPQYGRSYVLNKQFGGGVLCFRNLDDASKYQSAEFAIILVDELTKNSYETFTFLRTRLRWPGLPDIEAQFVAASNPGGPGHGWVKQFWMDRIFGPEWVEPVDYREQFAYVPSRATDNPYLDAAYWQTLNTLPEQLRRAFRDGDWNIFVGQAFPELKREVHAIRPLPVPEGAPLYMTFDWGFGKPFSVGWWWTDGDGRVYRFGSWYGASGPDQGLRMSDSEIAEGIVEREKRMGIDDRMIVRYAGYDCFNKKPDYRGGGQGPTTAETFLRYGLVLSPMDSRREVKIRQFREYLRVRPDGLPMMLIYDTDDDFFRTVSSLVMDKNNPEDVDTKGEDHMYDEACHICMARPLSASEPVKEMSMVERLVTVVEGKDVSSGWFGDVGGGFVGVADEDDWYGGYFEGGGLW